ncbi:hypothetical protein Tco_0104975 [Tanacetum coccineum]
MHGVGGGAEELEEPEGAERGAERRWGEAGGRERVEPRRRLERVGERGRAGTSGAGRGGSGKVPGRRGGGTKRARVCIGRRQRGQKSPRARGERGSEASPAKGADESSGREAKAPREQGGRAAGTGKREEGQGRAPGTKGGRSRRRAEEERERLEAGGRRREGGKAIEGKHRGRTMQAEGEAGDVETAAAGGGTMAGRGMEARREEQRRGQGSVPTFAVFGGGGSWALSPLDTPDVAWQRPLASEAARESAGGRVRRGGGSGRRSVRGRAVAGGPKPGLQGEALRWVVSLVGGGGVKERGSGRPGRGRQQEAPRGQGG